MKLAIDGTNGALAEYLVVSLWANTEAATAVNGLQIEFKASTWGQYPTTDWKALDQPAKPADPISGAAASEMNSVYIGVSLISGLSIALHLY